VDDGYIAGVPSEVRNVMEHLKKEVEVLEIGRIDRHLAVDYSLKHDEIGWYYEQDMAKYIYDVIEEYETTAGTTLKDYPTPGAPSSTLMKLDEDKEPIKINQYRKYVGKLLYAVTRVIPDCANATRELTCHLTAPGEDHWKALRRLLGYLKHHYKPLKMRAPAELRVIAMFDADWATDKNDRRSISSYVTTIGGTALTNYQSKKQQTVALSTCEAETMAGTLCAQDVLFTRNLLRELVGDQLLEPSYIYGDNVASLFLAQNNSLGQRTKHIDIRHRFMNELVSSQAVELRHIPSKENISDVNSKNVKLELHKKFAAKLYEGLIIAEVRDTESSKEDVAGL
jgi:hypothetical protein